MDPAQRRPDPSQGEGMKDNRVFIWPKKGRKMLIVNTQAHAHTRIQATAISVYIYMHTSSPVSVCRRFAVIAIGTGLG